MNDRTYFMQSFFLFVLGLLLCTSCELEESNQRGYVISKTNELPTEDSSDLVQP